MGGAAPVSSILATTSGMNAHFQPLSTFPVRSAGQEIKQHGSSSLPECAGTAAHLIGVSPPAAAADRLRSLRRRATFTTVPESAWCANVRADDQPLNRSGSDRGDAAEVLLRSGVAPGVRPRSCWSCTCWPSRATRFDLGPGRRPARSYWTLVRAASAPSCAGAGVPASPGNGGRQCQSGCRNTGLTAAVSGGRWRRPPSSIMHGGVDELRRVLTSLCAASNHRGSRLGPHRNLHAG